MCLLLSALPVEVAASVVHGAGEDVTHAAAGRRKAVADSIMEKVIFFAPFYETAVDDYRAGLYIKGRVDIIRRNRLIRFLPTMFRLRKGVDEYLIETFSELHYTAPDIYDQKVKAVTGTASGFWEADGHLPEYFHINVYSPSLLYDQLVSPLAPNARKYYSYSLDTVTGNRHERQFKIRFVPRYKSFQLVEGYMVVSDNVWSLREIRMAGRSELFRFDIILLMGRVGSPDEFLPTYYFIKGKFKLLGNEIEGDYLATLDYTDITQARPDREGLPERPKNKYDLTESYTLRTDTNALRRDTASFNALRPIPLTPHEKLLYADYFRSADTLAGRPRRKALAFWGQVGDLLTSRYTVDLQRFGSVRCSPIINPLLLSYSGSNGLSYRQEFKYSQLFRGDRLLRIVPRVGYNFKQKEFYWRMVADFDYWPQKRAALHLDVGNGNRIYSSEILDDLKAMPDSVFDFSKINMDYFKDLYLIFSHSWEVVNGLTFDVGLSIHHRTAVEKSDFTPLFSGLGTGDAVRPGTSAGYLDRFRNTYSSFAPRVRLTWTPGQYYYMNGARKVNLHSHYPTVSLEWERGIKGVLPNSNRYERIELDAQYNLKLGLMRDLYFRLGCGAFTDQQELYFVDFANLRRSNLPTGWNDEIGGVFQLLDGRWYNSSNRYLRAHVTYEAPFLLMRHLRKYTQYVLNERIYYNMLFVPHLNPYIELGYGIGTNIFDFGLFASFANLKYQEVGVKFTFELFND